MLKPWSLRAKSFQSSYNIRPDRKQSPSKTISYVLKRTPPSEFHFFIIEQSPSLAPRPYGAWVLCSLSHWVVFSFTAPSPLDLLFPSSHFIFSTGVCVCCTELAPYKVHVAKTIPGLSVEYAVTWDSYC